MGKSEILELFKGDKKFLTVDYISNKLNCSKKAVNNNLKDLQDEGIILKQTKVIKTVYYSLSKKK